MRLFGISTNGKRDSLKTSSVVTLMKLDPEKLSGRQLKQTVLNLLQQDDLGKCLSTLCGFPARQVVNPLFSYLCSMDDKIKWHAVTAMERGQIFV